MAQWNESLSNQLKQLNTIKNPTAAQKAKIAQLQSIKQASGGTVKKPVNQQILKNNPTNVKTAVQGQFDANQAFAGQQDLWNRPNQQGPTGSRTYEVGPDGRPIVKDQLSGNQQNILAGQEALSQWGNQTAMSGLQGAGLDKAFDPTNANFQQQQQFFTDNAFKQLTRRFDEEKTKDRTELEQALANKGIPTTPGASEAYDTAQKQFNQYWGDRYDNAQSQAINQGLQMWGDVANTAAGINNQNLSQAQNLSGLGSGLLAPNFQPTQGINLATPDVGGLAGTFGQLANQKAALKPQGGGGQPQQQQPASPFYSTPMGGSFQG